MEPAYQQITVEVSGGIATITFDRPEKLNAWTSIMESELTNSLARTDSDSNVRAIILTGAGRGFCSGADLTPAPSPGIKPEPKPEGSRFAFLRATSKPVFAAINGPAAGVGLSIALHCDFRYMAQSAKLTTAFARRGLIAEHGSAWLLVRLVGAQNAMDLLISGRTFTATQAADMGLVRLLPDEGFLAQVQAMAAEMVGASSPRSMRVIKKQVYEALDQTYAMAAVTADREQAESQKSADFKEGVSAFLQKRPATFTGT